MNVGGLEAAVRKLSLPLMVFGGALAALGLSGYHRIFAFSGWSDGDRIEIAIGVALFIVGMFFRKQPR